MKNLHLGVIASEFFDPRVGPMGGFGWAARMLSQVFQQQGSQVELVYLASGLHATAEQKEDQVHGSRLLLRRHSRLANLCAVQRERFHLLLTVDYHHADTVYLRAAPRTPAIIWVRDPRTPDDVRKIQTLRIPPTTTGQKTEAATETPQGLGHSDGSSMADIAKEATWLGRKLQFATTAPHLIGKLEAAYGMEPWDMRFLPNVIPVPDAPIVKSARPLVVFLGRLDPIKRPWIFAALAAHHPDVDFLFMGQAHFQGAGAWRAENRLPNLRFLGHVDEEEKRRVLSSAWVAVNTSIHEGLAISFLEALACQTPLLACQNPGFVVSRHGIFTGRFDGSGMDSLKAFSAGLRTLVDNPKLRRELGTGGQAWVAETHSHSRFLESFSRLCGNAGVNLC